MRLRATLALLGLALTAGAAPPAGPDPTRHIPRSEVEAAFARGAPLVEVEAYKVHASRRSEPGQAEVHLRDTDVIHVLEGRATLVTGGSVRDPVSVAPDEIRGSAIEGGNARELAAGDVLVVPQGTPHWFRAVRGPVLYYVVKVSAP